MTQFEPVTRKKVAEEAGVSTTIVSYVVNGNRYVDEDKRRRVNETIKKLGYRPNAIARTLKSKRSHHILFVADRIDNEHFGKLLAEKDNLLYSKGYLISLSHNRNNDEFIQHFISRYFDGVIINSISMREEYIHALADAGIPIVLFMNRSYVNLPEGIGEIYTGLYDGARMCVRHLYEQGRRQIVYIDRISDRGHFSDLSDLRLKGYVDELAALNLSFHTDKVITGCVTEDDVNKKICSCWKQSVKENRPIDAIFARNDRMAAVAMHSIRDLGLKIPQDIAVIGFDNSNLSRYIVPALSTMEIDREAVAKATVELMQKIINREQVSPVTLQTKLVVRDSTVVK